MAKIKSQKLQILEHIGEKFNQAKTVVFTSFNRLKVKENEAIRNELKSEGNEYYVVKKTLLDLALKKRKTEGIDVKSNDNQIALVFGYEDEVSPARIIYKHKKELKDKIELLGGILDNKTISAEEVTALAQLPTTEELHSKLVSAVNYPISGLVNSLAGNIRNLVQVLKAVSEK